MWSNWWNISEKTFPPANKALNISGRISGKKLENTSAKFVSKFAFFLFLGSFIQQKRGDNYSWYCNAVGLPESQFFASG